MNDTQIWPTEPRMYIDENSVPHNEKAERLNGRLAMLGVMAAIGSYAVTGQLILEFGNAWTLYKTKAWIS